MGGSCSLNPSLRLLWSLCEVCGFLVECGVGWIFGFVRIGRRVFKMMWSGMDFWFCSYRETLFKMMWSGRDFWFCLYRETLFKVKRYSGGIGMSFS